MRECVESVCRLCLSSEGLMMSIFQDRHNTVTLRFKILTCADIQIFTDDGLPSTICHHCLHQVETSYNFRRMAEKSDIILRSKSQNKTDILTDDGTEIKFYNQETNGWNSQNSEHTVKEESFVCSICSVGLSTHDQLLEHFQCEHPSVKLHHCKCCTFAAVTALELKKHFQINHTPDILKCEMCEKVYQNQIKFEEHKISHDKIVCKFCKQLFSTYKILKQHEQLHLDKFCKLCNEEFASKSEYMTHSQVCSKCYNCYFCNTPFNSKKDMMKHVVQDHENAPLHKCLACEQVFFQWTDLQTHVCQVRIVHKCGCCNLTFDTKPELKNHMNQHKPLKCKFCFKKFGLKSSLKRHEKCHSGLKPYQCKYCPKRFKDNSSCVVHIRTHTGERPFECRECNKHFRQLANLKMHVFRHHKKTVIHDNIISEEPLSNNDIKETHDVASMKVFELNTSLTSNDMFRRVMGGAFSIEQEPVYSTIQLEVPEVQFCTNLNNS